MLLGAPLGYTTQLSPSTPRSWPDVFRTSSFLPKPLTGSDSTVLLWRERGEAVNGKPQGWLLPCTVV